MIGISIIIMIIFVIIIFIITANLSINCYTFYYDMNRNINFRKSWSNSFMQVPEQRIFCLPSLEKKKTNLRTYFILSILLVNFLRFQYYFLLLLLFLLRLPFETDVTMPLPHGSPLGSDIYGGPLCIYKKASSHVWTLRTCCTNLRVIS